MAERGSNIYKRKDGRFEGRVAAGYRENGSIRYKSVYGKTLAEVKQKMSDFYSVRKEYQTSDTKIRFKEAAEQWFLSAKLRIKQSSCANYQNILNKHLLPAFGNMYMSGLSSAKVNEFILQKLKAGRLNGKGGLSSKFVMDIMMVFRSISVYAEREYGIRAVRFTMPRTQQKNIDILNKDERTQLQNYLLQNQTRTNITVLLCMFTGLRVGELCGLKWNDINLDENIISVNRTVQRINRSGYSEVVISSPKSRSSVRQIPIPAFLKEILAKQICPANSYLITGTENPAKPRTMQNRFKAILKYSGVRIVNFHVLRHTYATVCIEHGFDPKTLSELLGHADAGITLNRYVHSSMQLKQNYVGRLQLNE